MALNRVRVAARSTMRPAYITATSSVRPATTPRSWVISTSAICRRRCSRASRSRICACTVTSSAVVGSSAIRSRGSQESAMAIATRCRMPPERWCGYWRSRASGVGMPTSAKSSTARTRAWVVSISMCACRVSTICVPMLSTGLSEVIGSCNTTAIERARSWRSASGASVVSSRPSSLTRPLMRALGGSRRSTARASMVLPDPDSPTMPRVRPAASVRLTWSTARSGPRAVASSTPTPSISSRASAISGAPAADRSARAGCRRPS